MSFSKNEAATMLMCKAIDRIKIAYGTGSEDGITPLAYHNAIHTQEVIADGRRIQKLAIERKLLTPEEAVLTDIALAYHDVVQCKGRVNDTAESVQLFLEDSKEYDCFSEKDRQLVIDCILSTTFVIVNGTYGQNPKPQYPCLLVTDADLASIASISQVYWERANRIERENLGKDYTDTQKISFLKQSQELLSSHVFFTQEAKELFPYQESNLKEVEAAIAELEALQATYNANC